MLLINKTSTLFTDQSSSISSVLSFRGTTTSTSNSTSYTFNNVDIGTPAANRVVIVCIKLSSGSQQPFINTPTIGGANMTLAADTSFTDSTGCSYIYYKALTTGSTANISITTSNSQDNCAISVYAGYTATPDIVNSNNSAITSGTIDANFGDTIVSGGFAIFIGSSADNVDRTASWSGGVTKDADLFIESGTLSNFSTASLLTAGSFNVGITWTSSSAAGSAAYAVWNP